MCMAQPNPQSNSHTHSHARAKWKIFKLFLEFPHTDAKNIYPSPDTASPSPLFYAMCAVCKYVLGAFGYAGALYKTNNIILWRMQKCNRYTHTYHISSIESSACGVWYMFCVCAGRSGEDMMIEQVLLALWLSTNRSSARASILSRGATNDSTTRCGLARWWRASYAWDMPGNMCCAPKCLVCACAICIHIINIEMDNVGNLRQCGAECAYFWTSIYEMRWLDVWDAFKANIEKYVFHVWIILFIVLI